MLNPITRFNSISEKELKLQIGEKAYDLKGGKVEKYFIPFFKYYISPISMTDLMTFISKNIKLFVEKDFLQVIQTLFKYGIILWYIDSSQNKCLTANVALFDYTHSNNLKKFCKVLSKASKSTSILLNCNIIDTPLTVDPILFTKYDYDIVLVLVWAWYPVYEDVITAILASLKKSNTVILPIVCNDNYFSIGPQVIDERTKQLAYFVLDKEKNRYSKFHYDNYYTSDIFFLSNLANELFELTKKINGLVDSKSKTINRIITNNYFSGKLSNKKLIDL